MILNKGSKLSLFALTLASATLITGCGQGNGGPIGAQSAGIAGSPYGAPYAAPVGVNGAPCSFPTTLLSQYQISDSSTIPSNALPSLLGNWGGSMESSYPRTSEVSNQEYSFNLSTCVANGRTYLAVNFSSKSLTFQAPLSGRFDAYSGALLLTSAVVPAADFDKVVLSLSMIPDASTNQIHILPAFLQIEDFYYRDHLDMHTPLKK